MDLVSSLKNLLGYWAQQAASSSGSIDNWIFALHYKFTSAILIICGIIVAINQYILNPIKCMSSDISPNVLNTFCWMQKKFRFALEGLKTDRSIPYPGVDVKEPENYHSYYQWICFVLFVQAITFYIPGYFWKAMERNRIKNLTMGLDSPAISEETKRSNTKLIVQYLMSSLQHNDRFCFYFVMAEIMNFVNVVAQTRLIDDAFDGVFSTFGSKVIQFSEVESQERDDPMVKIFPRMISCSYHRYGASGAVQRHDSMCVLPINEVSEKIYIFLWFWFFILAILSGWALIYRFAVILSPRIRFFATKYRDTICNAVYLKIIVKKVGLGDWFVLDLLAKNVDPQNFRDIVHDLAKELDGNRFYHENCRPPSNKSF